MNAVILVSINLVLNVNAGWFGAQKYPNQIRTALRGE